MLKMIMFSLEKIMLRLEFFRVVDSIEDLRIVFFCKNVTW